MQSTLNDQRRRFMAQYMVDISIPANPNAEFFSLIPAQRAHVERLLEQGTVMGYSLSLDRTRLWITLTARNEHEAMEILKAFPLYQHFTISVHPLMFHNTSIRTLLKVSLN
jgi:muconolactone delta-isomerase